MTYFQATLCRIWHKESDAVGYHVPDLSEYG